MPIQKTIVELVFFVCAGATICTMALAAVEFENPTQDNNILVILAWLQIMFLVVTICFYVSNFIIH